MALAIHCERLILEGEIADYAELSPAAQSRWQAHGFRTIRSSGNALSLSWSVRPIDRHRVMKFETEVAKE